jgi:hypothetical protein
MVYPGFEPGPSRSEVRSANHWATRAQNYILLKFWKFTMELSENGKCLFTSSLQCVETGKSTRALPVHQIFKTKAFFS